jgi:hypothetical protein
MTANFAAHPTPRLPVIVPPLASLLSPRLYHSVSVLADQYACYGISTPFDKFLHPVRVILRHLHFLLYPRSTPIHDTPNPLASPTPTIRPPRRVP